ncbi:MAG: NADH-quinone oxidoreductase subunit NuoN [Gammaproteobacteria bacterium]
MNLIDLQAVFPEAWMLAALSAVLIVGVSSRDPEHTVAYWLAQFGLIVTLIANTWAGSKGHAVAFGGMYLRDPMAVVLKNFIIAFVIVGLIYARDYLSARRLLTAEYFVLAMVAVLGMMIMVSAGSLLTVYLGMELLSLSLYAMVAMHRDSPAASEAAMKYFVTGALASGMLLYGMSMLYGLTGSLGLADIATVIASGGERMLWAFAVVFIVAGVAFKLGAAPFHMWIPDVYEGAPTAVTLFIATAPKMAAFAMAIRLLSGGLQPMAPDWQQMLIALAVASIALGNIVAIAQSNIKRLFAYSAIAHMGYLLLGILTAGVGGYAASMFYAIVYTLMSLGTFGIIMLVAGNNGEADMLDDYKGLSRRRPWFAFLMLVLVFSMAGVPPFAGFWAKWYVLKEVVQAGHVWLAALSVVFSIIGAFYYLRIVKLMYFDEPEQGERVVGSGDTELALSVNGIAVLLLGLMPGLLMAVCAAATR